MAPNNVSRISQVTEVRVTFTPVDDLPQPASRGKAVEIANMMLESLRIQLEKQIMEGMYPVGYSYRTRDI